MTNPLTPLSKEDHDAIMELTQVDFNNPDCDLKRMITYIEHCSVDQSGYGDSEKLNHNDMHWLMSLQALRFVYFEEYSEYYEKTVEERLGNFMGNWIRKIPSPFDYQSFKGDIRFMPSTELLDLAARFRKESAIERMKYIFSQTDLIISVGDNLNGNPKPTTTNI